MFSIFALKSYKQNANTFFSIFPPEGNFDIDARDGGDHLGPPKFPTKSKNYSYENCSHFWDIFRKMFKHPFTIGSYIQKMTHNPINAFKIIVYNRKHTNNTKTRLTFSERKKRTNRTNQHFQVLILLFIKFPKFLILYILYIHVFIF